MLASWLLRRTSLRQRYLAIAAVGTVVALGNLLALTRAMFVSAHAATVLAVVLTYASAAGLATASAAARSSATALDRVTRTAGELGDGDLSARVGTLDAGPELDHLAATLDQMADRLQSLRHQEQRVERTRDATSITAVSHDLRTPLANLRAMSEAIDDGVVEDADRRAIRREMGRAVGQLIPRRRPVRARAGRRPRDRGRDRSRPRRRPRRIGDCGRGARRPPQGGRPRRRRLGRRAMRRAHRTSRAFSRTFS